MKLASVPGFRVKADVLAAFRRRCAKVGLSMSQALAAYIAGSSELDTRLTEIERRLDEHDKRLAALEMSRPFGSAEDLIDLIAKATQIDAAENKGNGWWVINAGELARGVLDFFQVSKQPASKGDRT